MKYYYNPEVRLLLIPQSREKKEMVYDHNVQTWKVPKIGPRPPYYANPRYGQFYPVI